MYKCIYLALMGTCTDQNTQKFKEKITFTYAHPKPSPPLLAVRRSCWIVL